MSENYVLRTYRKISKLPGGSWLFGKVISRRAPYFGSVAPRVTELRSGYCECLLLKRRKLENHIGTMHVIAIANGLELAMGTMAEASTPKHLRWIPKGMQLDYVAKAGSDIRCIAKLPDQAWQPGDVLGEVEALDTEGRTVVSGHIKLWITEKGAA